MGYVLRLVDMFCIWSIFLERRTEDEKRGCVERGEKVHNARPFTKVVHNTPIGTGCPHHAKIKIILLLPSKK
jgi:hypothetical protein